LSPYISNVFQILLTRLQKSRTDRYVFRFVELIYFLAAAEKRGMGPSFVVAAVDAQGPGLLGQLLQMFILPKTKQIKGRDQVIVTIVGITRLLTESQELQVGQYARFWREMLTAMIQLRQAEVDPVIPDDEIEEVDIEETGFQATYAKLAVAGLASVEVVPFPSVDEAVKNFVVKLTAADAALGGALLGRIRNEFAAQEKAVLAGWGVAV
jgi:exportin-2 (importin alpha re-exporter)